LYSNLAVDNISSIVTDLLNVYKKGVEISSSKEATELTPGDGLLILSAYLIQQCAFHHSKSYACIQLLRFVDDLGMLLEAIVLLEHGLLNSKYNFQMKIMASSLYSQIGSRLMLFKSYLF
jgi:hypothetical protein